MKTMYFTEAIDDALAQAMAQDSRIILFGEDIPLLRRNLLVRFGPNRVMGAPISESAFLGAGVAAAMAGLRPVVELYMVDFLSVAMDALLNHAAKIESFSGGKWTAPVVVRTPCGGGYGDGGQHEQSLWGWLAHIPGLTVVVPSTPADAGGLMLAALHHGGPVIFLEHKLLSETWLEFLGSGGRLTVKYDVPAEGVAWPRTPKVGTGSHWQSRASTNRRRCDPGQRRRRSAPRPGSRRDSDNRWDFSRSDRPENDLTA